MKLGEGFYMRLRIGRLLRFAAREPLHPSYSQRTRMQTICKNSNDTLSRRAPRLHLDSISTPLGDW